MFKHNQVRRSRVIKLNNKQICFWSSLKNWARDVEEDINSQNDLIDRITNKTDQAQSKIEQQNKQMLEILKK